MHDFPAHTANVIDFGVCQVIVDKSHQQLRFHAKVRWIGAQFNPRRRRSTPEPLAANENFQGGCKTFARCLADLKLFAKKKTTTQIFLRTKIILWRKKIYRQEIYLEAQAKLDWSRSWSVSMAKAFVFFFILLLFLPPLFFHEKQSKPSISTTTTNEGRKQHQIV